nr:hypothetical protein [uncultured Lichenicoccus sp.]
MRLRDHEACAVDAASHHRSRLRRFRPQPAEVERAILDRRQHDRALRDPSDRERAALPGHDMDGVRAAILDPAASRLSSGRNPYKRCPNTQGGTPISRCIRQMATSAPPSSR